MKILYLHQYFNTPSMAGGTRSYEMAKRLVSAGHEVHIVTSWREPTDRKDWFEENIDGINVHWLPVPYSNIMSYSERVVAFFKYALQAGNRAINIGGDVVFATSTPLTIAIPGVKVSKTLRIPMVFEVRDLWPELPIAIGALKNPVTKFLAKLLEKYAYRHSAHIVALSPGMADGVVKAGYDKRQLSVIPNSADLDLFAPNKIMAEDFRSKHPELGSKKIVLYAGTLGVINGVSYFVDLAFEASKLSSDVCFVIIGGGKEWDLVNARAIELGVLNKSLFMYPSIPKTDLLSAFAAASISTSLFVDLKPMEANSANKFFDSLASGTAVAINYGGWQVPVLESYQAGLQLSRNVSSAALQIIDLLNNETKLEEMGRNARRLAEEQFSRDVLASRLERCLTDVVGES